MAIVKKNLVTQGLSGSIGNSLVFRVVGDRTIVSSMPTSDGVLSEAQQAQRQRFLNAVAYAKAQMQDEVSKLLYEEVAKRKPFLSAYNAAVADALTPPNISRVIVENYTGAVGDELLVVITDDFGVDAVMITIYDASGALLEQGQALEGEAQTWKYVATEVLGSLTDARIVVFAKDKPGNEVTEEVVLV